ncbi:hypothetical protein JOF56_002831 [Kibdelosporangium banguiense]|uniref:Helicase XPB/Ssl2 N-terminal domain-containing protein n=1 Tax=Kibdelosporangium banguiense TaxID=1365924 RepID=A0ABS4TDL9_9PSEU|nr:helicase-associated domain-containing protein [Kibdelosporangium banguiense]MBP2322446.1 hypothetical protein [Kibdelosporangium banguiense]
MTLDQGFAQYLLGLSETALADVLRRRLDVCLPPEPQDALQLAHRLLHRGSVAFVFAELDHDALVVAQAVQVLAGHATRDAVIELLNADPVLLHAALRELTDLGLAWPYEGTYYIAPALAGSWSAPLGLGSSIHRLVADWHADRCRELAASLGLKTDRVSRAKLIDRIGELMSDSAEVGNRVAKLSAGARTLLDRLCVESPRVHFDPAGRSIVTELLMRGLLVQIDYRVAELPAEIGMALSPPGSRFKLTGPPSQYVIAVDPVVLGNAGAAAAHETLTAVTSMLDDAERTPIAQVKSGGVGVREQKRLAKALRCTESDVALWIDLAFSAELLAADRDGLLVPTEHFDSWRDLDQGSRWLILADAWYSMEHAPTDRIADGGRAVYPPLPMYADFEPVRRALLRMLSRIEGAAEIDDTLGWYCPVLPPAAVAGMAQATVAEATKLGVIAHGALTPLGRALLAGDQDLARDALPEVRQSVDLQSDLTAIVGGEPTRQVLNVLRTLAEPETSGAASTWRFTPGTVRKAFDAGMSADSVLESLASIAPRGVPQPLEYLVKDVARRHGRIRVATVGCCVVTDETHTTEILATRSLKPLALRQIASTVLVSAASVPKTLEALRAAGFAPVSEAEDGTVLIEHTRTRRTSAELYEPEIERRDLDLAGLAAGILKAGNTSAAESQLVKGLRSAGPALSAAELTMLASAIETGMPVRIQYQSASGGVTSRVIEGAVFDGLMIEAWCTLRDDVRVFSVERILAVDPA